MLPHRPPRALAQDVKCTDEELIVSLLDGRTISVPILWFPKLANATPDQRANFQILGHGEGIHWPDIDEDLSVKGLYGAPVSRRDASRLG
jgi:hypothetical protein